MALTDIDELRSLVGDTSYTNEQLAEILVAKGSLNGAAAFIWQGKVTESVGLVDISESGSSRKMSGVHSQNLAMAEYYRGLAENTDDSAVNGRRRGRVGYIERP